MRPTPTEGWRVEWSKHKNNNVKEIEFVLSYIEMVTNQ